MVDDGHLQHRPRTSRALRQRLIEAAEAAGAENPTFHESLTMAVAYLEVATERVTCPNCGATLSPPNQGMHGETRFECYECTWTPTFARVLGIDDPLIDPP